MTSKSRSVPVVVLVLALILCVGGATTMARDSRSWETGRRTAGDPAKIGDPCTIDGECGDGRVTVQFDWGASSQAVGCPNEAGAGDGTKPVTVEVVDNDGNRATITWTSFDAEMAQIFPDPPVPPAPPRQAAAPGI